MSSLDWDWLKSECMSWMKDKCNDVVAIENLIKLKDEAETRGFTREQVSKAIHKCRKIIDEANTSNQQPPMGAPEEKPPSAPKEEVQQLQQLPKQASRRTRQSYEAPANLTASGTRKSGASGGKSIVDGIL